MKITARYLLSLLCIALLLTGAALADGVVSPTYEFYVNDYADVLSDDTEKQIMDISVPLAQETGAQVVVLTVDSLDGMSIEDYGLEVGREWGIGGKDEDNGLLILLSVGDRQVRLEVGYGLEGAINDAKAGRLIRDYAKSYYSEDDFDTGTRELYNAAVSLVRNEYGLEPLEGYETAGEETAEDEDFTAGDWFYIVLFLLIGFRFMLWPLAISIINIFRRIGGRAPLHGGCLMGGGGGYHGGGFSGGGGGGFSGGGGSFGGGGSSSSF